MNIRISLLALVTGICTGCGSAPPVPDSGTLEFHHPQKIISQDRLGDADYSVGMSRSARYFSFAPRSLEHGQDMFDLASGQLRKALDLRADLYVTVEDAEVMPRIVRLAVTPDPRDSTR